MIASLLNIANALGLVLSVMFAFNIKELMEFIYLEIYWFGGFLLCYLSHGEGFKSFKCKKNR